MAATSGTALNKGQSARVDYKALHLQPLGACEDSVACSGVYLDSNTRIPLLTIVTEAWVQIVRGSSCSQSVRSHILTLLKRTMIMLPVTVQEVLRVILQATRTNSHDSSTDISACQALRSNIATNIPTWLTALPISQQQLVKDIVLMLMSGLGYLQPGDRVATVNTTLSAFEQSKTQRSGRLQANMTQLMVI
eukprot:jgi/Chrzof1/12333/Cz06g30200.t1